MKSYIKILFIAIGLAVSVPLLVASFDFNHTFFAAIAKIMGTAPKNILENGNFINDFNGWQYYGDVLIYETNGIRQACIAGKYKGHSRIWQEVNVISGQTYKLDFTLSGPDVGAFAIYKEKGAKKDKYFMCKGKNNNKRYTFSISPKNTGKNEICLSTDKDGAYYFSDVKFEKSGNYILKVIYITIALLIIIFLTRYSVIFLVLLLLLASIPVLQFTKDTKSVAENRALAEYKPLIDTSKKFNVTYGSDFNNWINDHIWLRNDFMKNQNSLKFLIDGKVDNKFVLQGKDKWLFLKGNLRRLAKPETYYNSIYDETAEAIKRFNSFCEENGARLYIVMAPFGEEVYSSEVAGVDISKKVGGFGKYIDCLNKDTGATIIYAYEALKKAKSEGLVQYKTDHHWTELGAYNVYKVVREVIFKDFNITQVYHTAFKTNKKKYDFGYGETFGRVSNISEPFARKIYPDDAEYIKFSTDKNLIIKESNARIENKSGINKKIFIFGDSYTRNIKTFFGYDFSNIQYQVKPLQISMPQFEEQIAKLKPDVVVMIIYSQNYNLIQNWYK